MNCPQCGHESSRVLETRATPTHDRRVRVCRSCSQAFHTIERVAVFGGKAIGYIESSAGDGEALEAIPVVVTPPADRYHPIPSEGVELLAVAEQVRPLMLEWWNNSRHSKHKSGAAWTRAAWLGAIKRVSELPEWRQLLLVQAGIESGWQTLKPEYIKDAPAPASNSLAPRSSAMQEAIERWHQQPA